MKDWKTQWKTQSNTTPAINIQFPGSQIAIKNMDIAATYYRKPFHERRQNIAVQWQSSLRTHLPPWLHNFVSVPQKIRGQSNVVVQTLKHLETDARTLLSTFNSIFKSVTQNLGNLHTFMEYFRGS